MAKYRGVTNARGIPVPVASGGSTPGGSDTQVQFNDAGVLAGDAGLTWDKVNGTLTVTGTAGNSLTLDGSIGAFYASFNSASFRSLGEVAFGDTDSDQNRTRFVVNDGALDMKFNVPAGTARFGDVDGTGNASLLTVDDANQRTVVNHDFVVDAYGALYLKDNAGTPHYWKLSVSSTGVLSTTDTGTSLP